MTRIITARAWNSYDSENDTALPIVWYVLVHWESYSNLKWRAVEPLRVIESTEENISPYKGWQEITLSGAIEVDEDTYQHLLAQQQQNKYFGPYRVDGIVKG